MNITDGQSIPWCHTCNTKLPCQCYEERVRKMKASTKDVGERCRAFLIGLTELTHENHVEITSRGGFLCLIHQPHENGHYIADADEWEQTENVRYVPIGGEASKR